MKSKNILQISSHTNALFKELQACLEPRGQKKHKKFILSGSKLVQEYLQQLTNSLASDKSAPALPYLLLHKQGHPGKQQNSDDLLENLSSILQRKNIEIRHVELTAKLFAELDLFGTQQTLLAAPLPQLPKWEPTPPPQGLEVLCALSDPANLGALLRSCAAFGASKIILLQEACTPFHPKALRTASGATFHIPLEIGPSITRLFDSLSHHNSPPLFALDAHPGGQDLNQLVWPQNARLLIGQEGLGLKSISKNNKSNINNIKSQVKIKYIHIPMEKGVESLNSTVAASLAIWRYRCNR